MLCCFKLYGVHRDTPVLTTSFPTRRSSDLPQVPRLSLEPGRRQDPAGRHLRSRHERLRPDGPRRPDQDQERGRPVADLPALLSRGRLRFLRHEYRRRSEENTSELQSLKRTSYAVLCWKKKRQTTIAQ